jgi:hypothetical protein
MGWSGEPYETFQRLVRKAEAGLESRMVTILTGQAEVRPELALAILERKFPQRWAKVTVVAAPPHHLTLNVADILQKVQGPEGPRAHRSRPRSRSASTCHNHQSTCEGRQNGPLGSEPPEQWRLVAAGRQALSLLDDAAP